MLNLSDYTTPHSTWNGIYTYVKDHPALYRDVLSDTFTEEELLKALKKQAQSLFLPKEYDAFRKSITALQKGKAVSLKRENIFRLFFALHLSTDTEAQDLLLNYLHQSELSARSLDEFIIIAALKLQLSWNETRMVREKYAAAIAAQPFSPAEIAEGQTAEVYYSVICDKLHSLDDLMNYLDAPENLDFFAKTCNTQYLALFHDVELQTLYTGTTEQRIRLFTDYGDPEPETMRSYYASLYPISEEQIFSLSCLFPNVFMSYDSFCQFVQRKRPVNISSGLFLLSLLAKLRTDDEEAMEDFYVDFLDRDEFTDMLNDILTYFGFPVLQPDLDPFERLVLHTYNECLDMHSDITNSEFQDEFLDMLWNHLEELAAQYTLT